MAAGHLRWSPRDRVSAGLLRPLSTAGLTAIICRHFDEQPSYRLAGLLAFTGAGLYALYYDGDQFELYRPLAGYRIPVYVGSAQSRSSSTGMGVTIRSPLRQRVGQHERSIAGSDLDVSEFQVRLLLMPHLHIDLGENGLRVGYKPVWNSVFRGFGSHEQGSRTRTSLQSIWDAVHGGRARTYGRPRSDVSELVDAARAVIRQQVAACGEAGGLDWSSFDPNTVRLPPLRRATRRPE